MKLSQVIKGMQEKRAELLTKAGDLAAIETPTAEQAAEFDTVLADIEKMDAEIEKKVKAEELLAKSAKPVDTIAAAATVKHVSVEDNAKISPMVRAAIAKAVAPAYGMSAIDYSEKRWGDNQLIKSAVAIGNTTSSTFASDLVATNVHRADLFVELLRPMTILGQMNGVRQFNFDQAGSISIPRQTGGVTAGWVGEGSSISVSPEVYDNITLSPKKIAVMIGITNELLYRADPSIEALIQDDLLKGTAQAVDTTFFTTAAAGSNSPAGILNGLSQLTGGDITVGTTDLPGLVAALSNMVSSMRAANAPMVNPVWVMSNVMKTYLQFLRNSLEQPMFPEISINNSLFGFPIIASNNVTSGASGFYALMDANQVLMGQDQAYVIDSSDVAAYQTDTAPATPPTPMQSAFQQDLRVFRIRGRMDWAKRYSTAAFGSWAEFVTA
jgi:HK97 family phage major capsid protein